jgi:hypothetical protein
MVRRGPLVIALALVLGPAICACTTSASARPVWPKPRPSEVDGGESLAPRAAARAIAAAAIEDDRPADRLAEKPVSPGIPVGPAVAPAAPAVAVPAAPSADDPITAEDLIIEIDGD